MSPLYLGQRCPEFGDNPSGRECPLRLNGLSIKAPSHLQLTTKSIQ